MRQLIFYNPGNNEGDDVKGSKPTMTKMKGFCSSNVLRTGVETTVLVVYAVTVCIVSLEVTVAWQLSMLEISPLVRLIT